MSLRVVEAPAEERVECAVLVMAKAPVAGAVKTRLSPPLSALAAARLAAAFLVDTWRAAEASGLATFLVYRGERGSFPPELATATATPQAAGDLGRKMAAAAVWGLRRARSAIIIGADLPGLPPERLAAAAALLKTRDAVLGPSSDGGFYLLGLRRARLDFLDELPWSAATTRTATLERLKLEGYVPAEIEAFDDVDCPSDLARLRAALKAGELSAPATEALLGQGGAWR